MNPATGSVMVIFVSVAAVLSRKAMAVPRGAGSATHHLSPGTSVTFDRSAFQSTASRGLKRTASDCDTAGVSCSSALMSSMIQMLRECVEG